MLAEATTRFCLAGSRRGRLPAVKAAFNYSATNRVFSNSTSSLDILELPLQFLHDSDPVNWDPATHQRNDVVFNLHNGKSVPSVQPPTVPKVNACVLEEDVYRIEWHDGQVSEYPASWVREQLQRWKGTTTTDRVLWTSYTEEKVRNDLSLDFDELLQEAATTTTPNKKKKKKNRALQILYQYGILLVTNTPTADDGAITALAAALGGGAVKTDSSSLLNHHLSGGNRALPRGATDGPLKTLYGTVWSTRAQHQDEGTSTADSAYGRTGLPLHTDMTYLLDPPGLQIFAMIQPAESGGNETDLAESGGGETVLADGFAAAERLRTVNPAAFAVLAETVRTYQSVDKETGWHLEASGPVISVSPWTGQVTGIRHNDLDRLPDLPPRDVEDVDSFFVALSEAHSAWDSILAEEDRRLVVRLEAGETMVVANQVCAHVYFLVSIGLV